MSGAFDHARFTGQLVADDETPWEFYTPEHFGVAARARPVVDPVVVAAKALKELARKHGTTFTATQAMTLFENVAANASAEAMVMFWRKAVDTVPSSPRQSVKRLRDMSVIELEARRERIRGLRIANGRRYKAAIKKLDPSRYEVHRQKRKVREGGGS